MTGVQTCALPISLTYRFAGHSRSDPGAYRPEGELDRWRERDPIVVLRAQLEAEGLLEKVTPHQVPLGHCQRCHTVVEPRLSRQ